VATNFPTSLDTLTNPTSSDSLNSPSHSAQHANVNDAVEALQAKVGADSSAVTSSHDYKIANLESRPVETKTASYTLVAGDVNKRIVMNSASATTITVNDSVFAAGDTVWIHNIGAGTTTVTAGTATVNTAGSLDVGQWEGGSLYFTSASSAIFFRGGGAVSAANFTDTATGTYSSGGKNYKYLTFNASGTLTVDTAGLADILLIGGGAGGGSTYGGGGGAGAHLYLTSAYLPVGTLTVTIGAGGAGGNTNPDYQPGQNGSPSRIGDYWSVGGGPGGSSNGGAVNQGSGFLGASGGGGATPGSGGASISGPGNAGGGAVGGGSGNTASGGGGGAGSAGTSGTTSNAGNGGSGLANSITGTSVTRAAGGGGGSWFGTAGTGGSSIGGNGTNDSTTATAGAANTGSGGGGGGYVGAAGGGIGGAGGSGVVIVRVEV
jgi:hypothetical protein